MLRFLGRLEKERSTDPGLINIADVQTLTARISISNPNFHDTDSLFCCAQMREILLKTP